MKRTATFLSLASAMFILASYGFAQSEAMDMATPAVHVAEHETLGTYLVDDHGRTLYTVVNGADVVPCDGECAAAWPPFTVQGQNAMAGGDVKGEAEDMAKTDEAMGDGMMATIDPAMLGTVMRDDGTTQTTYNGHPLYYFVGDVEPGDVDCQAVAQFGGTWYVMSPTGDVITTAN